MTTNAMTSIPHASESQNTSSGGVFSPFLNRILPFWGMASALLFLLDGWLITRTPREEVMGLIQKIFYIHLPSAWCAFLAFFIVFLAGIAYLVTRREVWDTLAEASAATGVLFTSIVLMTGSIWARSAWGVWWTWDVRLTTTLILWFLYVGYLVLRKSFEGSEKRAVYAAVYGIVGFVDVPVIHISIRLTQTQHPAVLRNSGGGGLDPAMRMTLLWSSLIFLFGFFYLWILRWREGTLEKRLARLEALRMERGERMEKTG